MNEASYDKGYNSGREDVSVECFVFCVFFIVCFFSIVFQNGTSIVLKNNRKKK